MINLTPHAIVIRLADNTDLTIAPEGVVARVSTSSVEVEVEGVPVPVIRTQYGEVENLPTTEEAKASGGILVSGLVLSRLGQEWTGVAFAPATGPNDGAVRNEKGHIVAVTKLVTV